MSFITKYHGSRFHLGCWKYGRRSPRRIRKLLCRPCARLMRILSHGKLILTASSFWQMPNNIARKYVILLPDVATDRITRDEKRSGNYVKWLNTNYWPFESDANEPHVSTGYACSFIVKTTILLLMTECHFLWCEPRKLCCLPSVLSSVFSISNMFLNEYWDWSN